MTEEGIEIELVLAERVGQVVAEAADAALARIRGEGQGPLDLAVRAALCELVRSARLGGELPDPRLDRVWLWIFTSRVVERMAGRRVAIDAGSPPRDEDRSAAALAGTDAAQRSGDAAPSRTAPARSPIRTTCPRADALARFAARPPREGTACDDAVARHLASCTSCRGAVAGALAPSPPPSREVLLASMRARLRALEGRLGDEGTGRGRARRRRPRTSTAWPVVASLALLLALGYGPLRRLWVRSPAPVAVQAGLRLSSARGISIGGMPGARMDEGSIRPGSLVACAPGAGEGLLLLVGGGRILLAPDAQVQVHADGDRTLLELRRGTAWFEGVSVGRPLRVLVGGVVAVVRDAAFVVRPTPGGIALEATAGTVDLETEAGSTPLEPGTPLTLPG